MSDTDREVLAMLDKAAADAPALHLDRGEVVARGRQIVRRRRATAGGMSVGALALAGVVWLGLGGAAGGGLLGTQEISPAGLTWEVDDPVTVVLDGVSQGGHAAPVTITKEADSTTATFVVDGEEETVVGRQMAGGADVFVGQRATVVLWRTPEDASSVLAWPQPDGAAQWGQVADDEDLSYLVTDSAGYVPQDLVFSTDEAVWTASGRVAETAELTDGRDSVAVFALPELDLAGFLQDGSITAVEPDSLHVSGGEEPWWRGGDDYTRHLVRVADGSQVQPVWVDASGDVVHREDEGETVHVGGATFALLSLTAEEMPSGADDLVLSFRWSKDGSTWHEQGTRATASDSFEGVTFSLDAGGEAVATRGGAELPRTAGHPEGEAWAWDLDGQVVTLMEVGETAVPVVRVDGVVREGGDLYLAQELVQVGDRELWAGRLPAGTELLGVVEAVGGAGTPLQWSLLGGDAVAPLDLRGGIAVAVDEERGLWAASLRPPESTSPPERTVVGEVDGPGVALWVDPARARAAVVHVGSGAVEDEGQAVTAVDALPVLAPGVTVVSDAGHSTGGISDRDGAWPGVMVRTTVVQCLKTGEACIEGMDTDGDRQPDVPVRQDEALALEADAPMEGVGVYAPGETVTLLGSDYRVEDTGSAWPVLRGSGLRGSITIGGADADADAAIAGTNSAAGGATSGTAVAPIEGRWPWSQDGTTIALLGLAAADDLDLVVEDGHGEWHEPDDIVIVQGTAGSATLLAFAPVTADAWGRTGVRGPDGEVTPLP